VWLPFESVALVHTAATYIVMAFMVVHIYVTITGRVPLSNIDIKAMLMGWEV